jgi:hypothetical protein
MVTRTILIALVLARLFLEAPRESTFDVTNGSDELRVDLQFFPDETYFPSVSRKIFSTH